MERHVASQAPAAGEQERHVPWCMPGCEPGLHTRQKFLAITDKVHSVAQRQKVLAHASDAPFAALTRRVALPVIQLLLRNVERGIGEIWRAVVAHGAPAVIRM